MLTKFKNRYYNFTKTVLRFPVTMAFLLAWGIMNCIRLFADKGIVFNEYAFAFLMGASSYVVLQILYERFFLDKKNTRYIFMAISIVFSAIYFMILRDNEVTEAFVIRTFIILFILFIAFLWIPTIKKKLSFNETFLVVFKSFFTVLLFAGLLYLGITLILTTIDNLIVSIDRSLYSHGSNIIFILYAPIHFLSLIPVFEDEQDNKLSKFLESLISYVFIPILAVFTMILLLYIVINITSDFWSDNLLESMLVSYSITVVFVYILSSQVDNAFSIIFRKIVPKVLIPIVLFQTISSIIKIGELGITHGRYYVIMFGIFATAAGIIFSIVPVEKNGIIAPILIAFSIISVLTPLDAITVSKANQTNRLENVLVSNDMLSDGSLKANPDLTSKDKDVIRNSIEYLDYMDYTKDIQWLKDYKSSGDFASSFGFQLYEDTGHSSGIKNFFRSAESVIEITGHDFIMDGFMGSDVRRSATKEFSKDGKEYHLTSVGENNEIVLYDISEDNKIIQVKYDEIFERFEDMDNDSEFLSNDDATFRFENDNTVLTIVVQRIFINTAEDELQWEADVHILVGIK